ncbi:MAG: vWA domain protein [Bryobacterales bacterium]|nr:vWA domain protein [Bryobacterales bacterium]
MPSVATSMTFLRPEYLNLLWALLALAIWSAYSLYSLRQTRRRLGAAIYSATSRPSSLVKRGIKMTLGLAALASLILALSRPRSVYHRQIPQLRHLDAIILLDTSPSMQAQDIQPSRLFRATEVIGEFIRKKVPEDRIGLISFAENSLVLSYLTGDPKNLLFYLDYLREHHALQYGTNIGGALKSAMGVFARQADLEPAARDNKKVLILLSDGEDHGEEMKAELRELVARRIPVYCVGIGSRVGSLIPIGEDNGQTRYLTGSNGQPILTTFDETTLQDAAEKSGGLYYRARTGVEMSQAFNDIFVKTREIAGYRQTTESRERYTELLAAAFVLSLLRMVL